MAERICSIRGCGKRHVARGFCRTHYRKWHRQQTMCSIPGCDDPVRGRGWCWKHYARWQRNGTTEDIRPTVEQRFWAKVDQGDGTGCWLWTGAKLHGGYGHMRGGTADTTAHRIAYELLVGPIPKGLEIDHLCRVRACVRPDHLEPVTRAENDRRGRIARGQG
jgi:HNH endonuclease